MNKTFKEFGLIVFLFVLAAAISIFGGATIIWLAWNEGVSTLVDVNHMSYPVAVILTIGLSVFGGLLKGPR